MLFGLPVTALQINLRNAGAVSAKFTDSVKEITFNGQQSLIRQQRVYYVTSVGVFHLTRNGMELIQIMPGLDIQKDVMSTCTMKFTVAQSLATVGSDVVTGENFKLQWRDSYEYRPRYQLKSKITAKL